MKSILRTPYLIALWFLSLLSTILLLAVGRLALWLFAAQADFLNAETLLAWKVGLRFDMMVAAYLSTPVLLCWFVSLFFPKKTGTLFKTGAIVSLIVGALLILTEAINFGFFCEYQDQFNVWVLGIINDDAAAIGQTILKDYHWERYLCAIALSFVVWTLFFSKIAKNIFHAVARRKKTTKTGIACIVLAVVVGIIFYRGGTERRPPRLRDAAPCDTEIVNNLVLNPVFTLKHVLIDLWEISNGGKAPTFVKNIEEQAKLLYGEKATTKGETIEKLITTRNKRLNPNVPAPKRVYLFIMESYDRWPMTEKYAGIGICETLIELEKRGASSPNFISGASGTMYSLSSIISGIPHMDVAQNYRPRGKVALPTSIATIFKRLGYKTRFAYSGYGSWQRIEDYVRDQGFDEIVLGSDVSDCPEKYKGEWGVPDGFLFSHLEKIDAGSKDEFVFTLIMSASYHPPYNLPLDELDCPPISLPPELRKICDGRATPQILSHFKYSDRELGKFIKNTSKKYPDSLFAVTGDHFSRRFLSKKPTLSEKKQVPFVLVSPGVPAGTQLPFGTHADMAPTLLALCAPDGFEYPTFGINLFSQKAQKRRCTIGDHTILHADGGMLHDELIEEDEKDSETPADSPENLRYYGKKLSDEAHSQMQAEVDAWRALAWTYFEKGNTSKEAKSE